MGYEHPVYTPASLAAQRRLPELDDGATSYAGAYHGWGFHEDGCASGVRAARSFGVAVVSASTAPVSSRPWSRTPGTCRRTGVRATGSTAGWSTWTRCRRCRAGCARSPGSTPATTSATRGGRIRSNLEAWLDRQRSAARRRPGAHARQRPRARPRVQPADRLLVPPRGRHARVRGRWRCTTPTASATATCCGPTARGARPCPRSSTSRRSSTVDGVYLMRVPPPGREAVA